MLTATFAFLSFKMLENRKKIINKPEVPTDGRIEQFVDKDEYEYGFGVGDAFLLKLLHADL